MEALVAAIAIIAGTSATVSVVWLIGRTVLRLRSTPEIPDGSIARLEARLERMEQAIDAMAVEMERVSEGQRFTTKLLSDRAHDRLDRPS